LKTPDIFVVDRRNLAMHQFLGVHDLAAEGFADRLVAEADAEQRNLAGEFTNRCQRNTCLRRGAGAGGNHQIVGIEPRHFGNGDGVVAVNLNILTQLAEILDEVVGEAVVIVDH
jgi:hypothetical protein